MNESKPTVPSTSRETVISPLCMITANFRSSGRTRNDMTWFISNPYEVAIVVNTVKVEGIVLKRRSTVDGLV